MSERLNTAANHFSSGEKLVVFGLSNIISDLLDAALANHLAVKAIVVDQPQQENDRDLPIATRLDNYAAYAQRPELIALKDFLPGPGERYLLGPTTPKKEHLALRIRAQYGLSFCTLTHPSAWVSPLAHVGSGVFVGANSVVAAGAFLGDHVFVNRGVTIGHDTRIGDYSRLQPGVNLGGHTVIGRGVTVGIGSTIIERLRVGDGTTVGAGSVVTKDVPEQVLVFGMPARVIKRLI